ncbi:MULTISPECIES: ArsR/SmtB family transcription factor [unclassified Mesorhizobium]|uniref:ArsR/SmtB family transcription factor n=1 Tax=unclassified Mesorhizobium TaxID=325217 RepID=UPI001CC9E111|nr:MULTISPECIES: metalloregulator ArsR/SmtB family transcription factor [unclassified Mesorhizobium]MBZ9698688.1 metalloregulator ArsR/SmtB family transcription factor [Mesorhizobium sp. CO1-1-9]MBZ9727566.1 metalloregulator ArsR/SmtB family transcription factor [Mesorhizobium sp. CO1-1-11]
MAEIKDDPKLRMRPRAKGRPSIRRVSAASRLFATLGFRKRLLILVHLMDGERSVSELVSLVGGTQTALSQHLTDMAKLGIVKSRIQGRWRLYSLTSEQAKMLVGFLSNLADNDKLPVGKRSGKKSSSWRPG